MSLVWASEVVLQVRMGHESKSLLWVSEIVLLVRMGLVKVFIVGLSTGQNGT